MISEDFAFFGFDDTSWNRLVDLFLGDESSSSRGVLVVVVGADDVCVAAFHTVRGSLDPTKLPQLTDLEQLCVAAEAGACIVMRERAMTELEHYLAESLDAEEDCARRVMRFARVLRELGNGNWLRVWPNPLPGALLGAAPATKPAIDFLLPDGTGVALGVFDEGKLWTGGVLRRRGGQFDVFAGPDAMSDWAGPLGGAWRRDHRVLTQAIERELGPLHVGLFMELPTARQLISDRRGGDWALAYATRDLIVHPLPTFLVAGLGLDLLGGVAQFAMQALKQMDREEMVSFAARFWSGFTERVPAQEPPGALENHFADEGEPADDGDSKPIT